MVTSKNQKKEKVKKIFSIKYKLILIFGLLTTISLISLTVFTIKTARNVAMEKVEIHLTSEAKNTAKIIDRSIKSEFKYLKTLARNPIVRNSIINDERKYFLKKEAEEMGLIGLYFADIEGKVHHPNGNFYNIIDKNYYKQSIQGKNYISEPYNDIFGNFCLTISVPVYNKNKKIIGILFGNFDGLELNKYIEDIAIGETGDAYIIGLTGITIADLDPEIVKDQENSMEVAKIDPSYQTIANFEKRALSEKEPAVDYFYWEKELNIASFAQIPSTGWAVIVSASAQEFQESINIMKRNFIIFETIILFITILVIYIVSQKIVSPLQSVANALKNIAQGDGDLTVHLPVRGNDEVSAVSQYFNETIKKINLSIKSVSKNTVDMTQIGQTLSSNMIETASSINQISANIKGVKEQVLNQSTGVTETSATMEEIIQTIGQLNKSIENQATSVAQSSSSHRRNDC